MKATHAYRIVSRPQPPTTGEDDLLDPVFIGPGDHPELYEAVTEQALTEHDIDLLDLHASNDVVVTDVELRDSDAEPKELPAALTQAAKAFHNQLDRRNLRESPKDGVQFDQGTLITTLSASRDAADNAASIDTDDLPATGDPTHLEGFERIGGFTGVYRLYLRPRGPNGSDRESPYSPEFITPADRPEDFENAVRWEVRRINSSATLLDVTATDEAVVITFQHNAPGVPPARLKAKVADRVEARFSRKIGGQNGSGLRLRPLSVSTLPSDPAGELLEEFTDEGVVAPDEPASSSGAEV